MGEHTPPAGRFDDVWPSFDAVLEAVDNCLGPVTAEEFLLFSCRVGRNASPALLMELLHRERLAPSALAMALADVWTGAEYPTSALAAYTEDDYSEAEFVWSDLFRSVGFTIDGVPAPALQDSVVLYRGASATYRCGMSWTSDLETARWFAERWKNTTGHAAPVWRCTAAPEQVLAVFQDARKESEFVVIVTESDIEEAR